MNWILIAAWTFAILSVVAAIQGAIDKDGPGWRLFAFAQSMFHAIVSYNLFQL